MPPLSELLERIAAEPPFRVLARAALRRLRVSLPTRVRWELSGRPDYLLGVYTAATEAKRQNVREISVAEFGVAGGAGLAALQDESAAVEAAMGIGIRVFGFDAGASGLPEFIGDYRDHPDAWRPGDYPMNEAALRERLDPRRTTLIIGDVRDTVPSFFRQHDAPPLGFLSVDLDLYSSTRDALGIFAAPGRRMLQHVPMYFDDVEFLFNHRFAGELLAIDEFNAQSMNVKIDRWHGVRNGRPFPERVYFDKFFVAHDLEGISRTRLARTPGVLTLSTPGERARTRRPSRVV